MEIINPKTVEGEKQSKIKQKEEKAEKLEIENKKSIDINFKILVIKTNINGLKSLVKNKIVKVNFLKKNIYDLFIIASKAFKDIESLNVKG